jgi:hypothetical protein
VPVTGRRREVGEVERDMEDDSHLYLLSDAE